MSTRTPIESQRVAARVAGGALLTIILAGVVGTWIGREHIVVVGDVVATAHNIAADAMRYRVGTALEIVMLNADVVLAVALYVLLKPVGPALALLGTFWRLVNAIVLATGAVVSLATVDVVTDPRFAVFGENQLPVHAALLSDLHGVASVVGLVSFGCGAAAHSVLLLRSGYIPKLLSGAYLLVAIGVTVGAFGFMVAPDAMAPYETLVIAPDFVVELLVALWLLVKGARIVDKSTIAH